MQLEQAFDQCTSEEQIAAFVDAVRREPQRRDALVALLPERSPLYAGRGANATSRIRGYILAAFGQVGLPEAALPYVLEELESGRNAYLVAAAAMALRGLDAPADRAVPFLLKAIANIRDVDDAISFESIRPRRPLSSYTTALAEIMTTFAWLGAEARSALPALQALAEDRHALTTPARATLEAVLANLPDAEPSCCEGGTCSCAAEVEACCTEDADPPDCCAHDEAAAGVAQLGLVAPAGPIDHERVNVTVPVDVVLEDQAGRALTFGGFFSGRPAVVAFFYTRCDNPNKCSLTITKLAALQRALHEEGLHEQIRTAAITYDPAYDLPARLRGYGENRGVRFSDNDRFLRTPAGLGPLQAYFELGVNFGQALVNRHRIELFVLDREGRIAGSFTRLQWDVAEVLSRARALVAGG